MARYYNPDQPRDERGRWATLGPGSPLARALKRERIKAIPVGGRAYNSLPKSRLIHYPGGKSTRTLPLSIGHEVGHILLKEHDKPLGSGAAAYVNVQQRERRAWAKGAIWLRKIGYPLKLSELKGLSKRSLTSYGKEAALPAKQRAVAWQHLNRKKP